MFGLLRFSLALGFWTVCAPGVDQVRIEHREGVAYELRTTRTMSMRLGEASMRVDGQEYPVDLLRNSVPDRDDVETVVVRNEVRKVAEGRPVHVVRQFVEVGVRRTVAKESTEQTGALEGLTLVLDQDADGEVEARLQEGTEATVDDAFLTGHRMEHGIHRLLPAESVEAGDSWNPDEDAVKALLLEPGPQHYDAESAAELPKLLADAAEFTAEMSLHDRVTLDGVECHRLELRVDLHAELDELPDEFSSGRQGEAGTVRVESEHRGELWIAVGSRLPVRFEIESEWTFDVAMNLEQEGVTIDVGMEFTSQNTSSREWVILD